MISLAAAQRLLDDMDKYADMSFYVLMDEQEGILDSVWLKNDEQALAYARAFNKPIINVLRYVGAAE